ncbi:MAG TPA: aminotransferase class V-fold PLP-dependent enzyme [Pyrinomonadaceae bacterium]|nr:aminotransferase class V-fold PLP-dependent enzyme [Pyrinomonadaceae bacterium]
MNRRNFLLGAGMSAIGGAVVTACGTRETVDPQTQDEWDQVRAPFNLARDQIDLSALFIASHPKPVRDAIERYRTELDKTPTPYLREQLNEHENEVLEAAASYLGANANEIALTDSTTMGLGLIYNGLKLSPGQQVITSVHDYYATHESLRLAAERTGAQIREIQLYQQEQTVTADEILNNIRSAIVPETRVLAMTWVHSSTGLKLPLKEIGAVLKEVNAQRDEQQRILLCVDGVHGFAVENLDIKETGCDFFMAGCHKWLFGPRGTGIIWGNETAWNAVRPTIPTFMDDEVRNAWLRDDVPPAATTARRMTPGGFKTFEYQWALAEAFKFHLDIGKEKIANRTHELNRQLKEGLAAMSHVKLYTPRDENLSSGITCFDVNGMSPGEVVGRLRQRNIISTVTPYAQSHARLSPSIRNSPAEIDITLREIRALA